MNYSNASLVASLVLRYPGARPYLDLPAPPSSEGSSKSPEKPSPLAAKLKDIERLEETYARLEAQYLRAEENCRLVREKNKSEEERDLKEIMKADAFAHRVLMQQIRILRDLRLAHKALESDAKQLESLGSQPAPALTSHEQPAYTVPASGNTDLTSQTPASTSSLDASPLTATSIPSAPDSPERECSAADPPQDRDKLKLPPEKAKAA